MKIIHIVHGKANPSGHNGISRVVYHLNKQEKLLGIDSQIWAVVNDAKSHYMHARDEFVSIECFPRVRNPLGTSEIVNQLEAQRDSIDLVHFHMIWFYDKNIIAKALKRLGIPFIITTHGTYSTHHAYTGKRKLVRALYELDFLEKASEAHVLTREEGTGLQRYGFTGRSFVVPNGVALEEIPEDISEGFFDDKPYADRTKAIWVGVLRDDKNLDELIRSVSMLPQSVREELVVVIVGPDYKSNQAKYERLASSHGVREQFDFVGPLYGNEKFDAIQSADFCIMPSFSEGMSLAILDALVCAKPCVLTRGCNMNYYAQHDFFVACEPYAQDLARGIERIFELRTNWNDMGKRGYNLCLGTFNWRSVAQEMIANYKRILSDDE